MKILIDTSIWIDHFKARDEVVEELLTEERVLMHPWIVGEVALGTYRDRSTLLYSLSKLPHAAVASDSEVLNFIDVSTMFGIGIGYVDAGLLASAKLTPGTTLWTRDKRLRSAAEALSIAAKPTH